nr:protein bzz1 [Quercus suber]
MAEVDLAPNFGQELKDGFKPVNQWISNGIQFLGDVEQFYRERSAIEKEYSQKLSALAKKYFEKKAKKSTSVSVGDTPTVTPGSLESASMTTWTVQITTLESRAAEHDRYATQMLSNVAEPVKHLANRYEDLRKQHVEYASKLEKERDGTYADLRKTKGKYDGVCQEVEHRRKKIESSYDHGKNKAQGAYQQQQSDMRNSKKEKYYHEYIPELLDVRISMILGLLSILDGPACADWSNIQSLQALSEAKTASLNNHWSMAAILETQLLSRSTQLLEHLSSEIPRNTPVLDSMMFVRHNASAWQDPADFVFEPSPVWLDDDVMASDSTSKTFLMNILVQSKTSLGELRRECDAKRREVEGAKRVRQAIRDGKDKRDEVEIVRAQFVHQEALHEAERKKITAEVEVSTITSAVGDVSLGAQNHKFKNETFRLPTNCDLCGDRIWGLSAKGLSCEDCGFTCHTKCQLKVPADCPGELTKEQRKSMKAERQAAAAALLAAPPAESNGSAGHGHSALQRSDTAGSMNTLSSGYAASAGHSVSGTTMKPTEGADGGSRMSSGSARPRVMAPPPAAYKTNGDIDEQKGRMLYAYQASGDGELSAVEGQEFALVESDDGSGWIKIRTSDSSIGLVPAAYTELSAPPPPSKDSRPISTAASASTVSLAGSEETPSIKMKKQGPAVAPRRGAKKIKHVEALYTYDANAGGETSMVLGERMILVNTDSGDGWVEVESRAGRGVVPASWVKDA